MRLSFSDGRRIREEAQRNASTGLSHLKRWWSDRYKLPPTHHLFTSQSQSEILLEMYEDLETQRLSIESQLESGDVGGETRTRLMEQLNIINKSLCIEAPQDDLWDEWESELAAGRVPDLEKGLE